MTAGPNIAAKLYFSAHVCKIVFYFIYLFFFYFSNFIRYPVELVFCCAVIRLVGNCCKPQSSVNIIIIINHNKSFF